MVAADLKSASKLLEPLGSVDVRGLGFPSSERYWHLASPRLVPDKGQRPVYKANQLAIIDGLGLPCRVRIVVESIGILDKVPKLVNIGLVENLLGPAHALIAEATEWPKQRPRREMFWARHPQVAFEDRADAFSDLSAVHATASDVLA